jgi:aryl-alcohol dehydrogenase-like predicted oxidoreductase
MVRGIEKNVLQYCEHKNIVIIPYKPIAKGALANPNEKLKIVVRDFAERRQNSGANSF